ncbi:MAG: hypothetical protein BGO77_01380 [Caedibacter sp. 37-49]|nr:MAG: hypothetical protein BGO77_01380 [Caedibacter sp. 37-49]
MKKIIPSFFVLLSAFASPQAKADCPTLSAKDMAYYLCPVVGSYNVIPQTTVVYQRPVDILGALSSVCSVFSKALRQDDKTYSGTESDKVEGMLVCHYKLPEDWKKAAMIDEFSLEGKIQTPPSLKGAVCPVLTFEAMSSALCQDKLKIGNGPWWEVKQQGAKAAVCNVLKGLLGGAKSLVGNAPQGTIKGQVGEGTTAFTHTCKYPYHSGSTAKELVLHGKMSLELLKQANEEIAKH